MIWTILLVIGVLVSGCCGYFLFFYRKKPKEQITINPIIEPKKVPKKLQNTGFMLSSLSVFEDFWCRRIPKDILKQLLDDFAEKGVGNWSRSFLFPASPWQYKYKNWLIPVFKKQNGLYQLPKPWNANDYICGYINPEFMKNVMFIIKEKVKREIGVMVSLWDNCGFHAGVPWNHNFLNPVNNTLGNLLSDHRHAYHLYADKTDNEQMVNTGLIVEALTKYALECIRDNLTPEERKFIAFEACNEGNAGLVWHARIHDIIKKTWGIVNPSNRLWTSSSSNKVSYIKDYFNPIAHKVGTLKRLEEIVMNKHILGISTDGWKESDPAGKYARIPVPGDRMAQILQEAYRVGFAYLETLNGHRQEEARLPGGKYNKTANKYWYDFSAMRWDEMKKVADKLLEIG